MILTHFERILEICRIRGWSENHKTLTIDRDGFKAIIREILRDMPFDENWYLGHYPDVAAAVARGEVTAREHYVEFGYFEGRLPGLNGFDGAAYFRTQPDLAHFSAHPDAIDLARDHFVEHGYREGRPTPSRSPA